MNTTESIVESYYRLCKSCFTMPDVKVIKGNNRQLDLLAYNLLRKESFHVEVSVTHCQGWCPTPEKLTRNFDKKFYGLPSKKAGKNTDYSKGKTYIKNIFDTYRHIGLDETEITRVWVCWVVAKPDTLEEELNNYCSSKELPRNKIQVVSFRDEILPDLLEKVSTSNYEDDSLRTLSLLRQHDIQKLKL